MRKWIDLVEGKLNSIQQALYDRIPETGSVKVNIDGSVMSTIRSLESAGLIDYTLNTSSFQAVLTRRAPPEPPRPNADITSPAFKNWFRNSKIVDSQGRPLIMYHGTDREFDAFDPDISPKAFEIDRGKFHFTDDLSQAEFYASELAGGDLRQSESQGKPRVIRAYLSIQNPYVVDDCDDPADEWVASADIFTREAKEGGHDGIVMQTARGDHRVVIAFSPNQIKAVDNHGTFDPTDARMTH